MCYAEFGRSKTVRDHRDQLINPYDVKAQRLHRQVYQMCHRIIQNSITSFKYSYIITGPNDNKFRSKITTYMLECVHKYSTETSPQYILVWYIPYTPHYRPTWPRGIQEVKAPRFLDTRHMKVVMSSPLRTGRLYPQAESTPGHINFSDASEKIPNDTTGERPRDLPTSSVEP
jgi:hypothetical protein